MNRARYLLLTLLLLVSGPGCAGTVHDVARGAIPGAMTGTLEGLNSRENQRLARQLLEDPEIRRTARTFAAEVLDDGLTVLSEPEREARIQQISAQYIAAMSRAITRSMATGLREDLGPAMTSMMRTAMRQTMRDALDENFQRNVQQVVGNITASTIASASRAMADSLTRDMAPALASTLTDPRLTAAMSQTTQGMGRDLVVGVNAGLLDVQRQQGERSFLSNLGVAAKEGVSTVRWVAIAGLGASVLLTLFVVFLLVRNRRAKADSERNAADAIMLAEAIRAAEGQPGSEQLIELVRKQLKHPEDSDPLAGMLERLQKGSKKRGRDDDGPRGGGLGSLAAKLQRPAHA